MDSQLSRFLKQLPPDRHTAVFRSHPLSLILFPALEGTWVCMVDEGGAEEEGGAFFSLIPFVVRVFTGPLRLLDLKVGSLLCFFFQPATSCP